MGVKRASKPITDADIPSAIARDAEITAAMTTHVAAADARYPQFKRNIYSLNTGSPASPVTSITHNLDASKIQSISSFVFMDLSISAGFAPRILPGGIAGLPGYFYSITVDVHNIICRLHPTNSGKMFNQNVTVSIDYS